MKNEVEPGTLTKETLQSAIDYFDDLIENPDRVLEIQPHPKSPIPVRLKNCKELSLLEYLKLKEEGKIK